MSDSEKKNSFPISGDLTRQELDQLHAMAKHHIRDPWDQLRWYIREDYHGRLRHIDDGTRFRDFEGLAGDRLYPDKVGLKIRKDVD